LDTGWQAGAVLLLLLLLLLAPALAKSGGRHRQQVLPSRMCQQTRLRAHR
jgi:hypothetical protein